MNKCIHESVLEGNWNNLKWLGKSFHIFINAEIYITFRTDGCYHVGKLVHVTDSVNDSVQEHGPLAFRQHWSSRINASETTQYLSVRFIYCWA